MFEVYKVEKENEVDIYYSECVDVVNKNCVVKLHNKDEITCDVTPAFYCTDPDIWISVGYLVYDMTDPAGQYDNTARTRMMRQSANQQLPR